MQIQVDGQLQNFVEIKVFRGAHHLPDSFRVSLFEPKDYTGLGSLEHSGSVLTDLRQHILERLPHLDTLPAWLNALPVLQQIFHEELRQVNNHIGLREVEVDFAAAGYGDVCRAWVYALIHAQAANRLIPSFMQTYTSWLFSTVRVSLEVYSYPAGEQTWQIQVITHIYGRIGLRIETEPGGTPVFVYDASLACPAEGFMVALLREVAGKITQACGLQSA